MKELMGGTILSAVLLYIIDMVLLKIFPHVPNIKFGVVFLSFCFSPVVIVFVTKALDCLRDIKRKPKKANSATTIVNEKKKLTPTVSIQKTQDDNKVEKTKSQTEVKPVVNTDNTELAELKREANSGDSRAQYGLGMCYKLGDGVPVDDRKMVKYLTAAAKQGYEYAQYEMGRLYELGRGVAYDADKALYWYEKCFEKINSMPCTSPLKDYSKERIEILKSKTRVSKKSGKDKREEYEYLFPFEAELKEDGKELLRQNVLLAETGDVNAIHHVGVAYFYGYGIKQNREKGLILLRIAAQKGNPCTQYMLGKLYQNGGLVKPDCEKEKELFEMAAEHGDFDAQYELGGLYKKGIVYQDRTIVPKDTDKAKEWYKKAAQDASFCRKACVRSHINDIENGTDKMHRYYEKNYGGGINAKVHFYDKPERKFIDQSHSLKNLEDNDICVYSLTPKGEKSPKWLIVKVTMAGCMERYFNDRVKATEQRCVIMEKMDYEKTSPMNLFGIVRDLTSILRYNIRIGTESNFYKDNGLFSDKLEAKDFFSIEVDSKSKEPGAEIYLRDKEYFLNSDKKTEVTESQTSAETIANTKKSESVNGKHGRLIFNDPYGKFTNQTASVPKDYDIEIGVQAKNGHPVALTIKVTGRKYENESNTNSYFKADYNMLQVKDFPLVAVQMTKCFDVDFSDGKKETYRALIGSRIKTITKEQYESLGFDFKVNEKKHEANDNQDKLSDQTSALIIPEGTTEIITRKFKYRKDIVSVVIPKGVKTIGEAAFKNCENLKTIHIPDSVKRIENNAFGGCKNLTSVVIPEGVTTIEPWTFAGCASLETVVIPESVTAINDKAFFDCKSLKNVHISSLNDWFNIEFENFFSNPLSYAEKLYVNGEAVTKFVVPEGVTEIKSYSFYDYKGLSELVIPKGVTEIGNYAFSGCENLTSVKISEGVTAIGSYAFSGCKNLTALTIPEGVTTIDHGAFAGCENLTSVKIPEGVTTIDHGAFSGCKNLTSVKIPEGVTAIDSRAFYECVKLTDVKMPESVTEIGAIAFSGCANLKTIVIPDSVKTMGHSVFDGCINLKSVVISKSISEIKFQTFKLCENLSSIKIPEGVTKIDEGAFSGCVKLTDVKIPENVEYIGKEAFARCFNLKTVEFPKSDPEINPTAFLGCNCINEEIKVEIDRIVKKILPLEEMEDYIPPYDESFYKSVLLSRENESKMSYGNGILSIVDHRGRYMGMQDVAGGFLTGVCIDISTQGPDDNPTAVVITVYDKEDAGKNFEDIKFVTTMKADYEKTATQLGFKIFVEAAKNTYYMNRKYNKKGAYYYVCTGIERYRVTSETFNNPNLDFSWSHFKALQRTFYLLYLKKNPGASYDDFEKYVWDALPQDYETPRDDPKFDASIEPSHTVRKTEKRIAKNGECYWVKA